MKIASVVYKIKPSVNENIEEIKKQALEAKKNGADMVLFSECALSGFIVGKNVIMDRKIALSANELKIKDLCQFAKDEGLHLGFGFLQFKDGGFYDSYAIVKSDGTIRDLYERCSDTWHIKDKGNMYDEGDAIRSYEIDELIMTTLIGGDIEDEVLPAMASALEADLCLVPMAHTFQKKANEDLWNGKLKELSKIAKKMNTNLLVINQLMDKDDYYGGVAAITADGKMESSLPIYKEGIHYLDI